MKNGVRQKLSRIDIKHEAILNAARKIFLKRGFMATSMDEVAQQANVSKKTVYGHFNNKKKLFEAMLSEHWNRLLVINNNLFNEKKSIAANLTYFAKVFLKFLYQQDTIDLFKLLIGESNQFPNLVDNIVVNEKAPFTKALVEFLNQKKKNRELTIDNTERSAAYFMGLLKEYHFWPMMLGFTKQKKLINKKKLIDEAVSIFLMIYANSAKESQN